VSGIKISAYNGRLINFNLTKKTKTSSSDFEEFVFRITLPEVKQEKTPDEMNFLELLRKNDLYSMIELNFKMCVTLSTIPLFLIGLKVSRLIKKTSIAFSILYGVIVAFFYNIILTASINSIVNYNLSPFILHIPNLLLLIIGLL
ncbi:MAG: LptF/LptG family permease, partial [bacterium]|nr:LptF/LptG family permease [bacterium]